MSSRAALAAARKRRGAQATPVQTRAPQPQQSQSLEKPPQTNGMPQGKFNVNQFMIFLNNKIENIDNRISQKISELEEKIDNELSTMKTKNIGVTVELMEQTVETQKLKLSKMNSFITELQNSYLVLNTSLLKMQQIMPDVVNTKKSQAIHGELLGQNLTKVTIEEEEEDQEEDPKEDPKEDPVNNADNVDETPMYDSDVENQPEPTIEDENMLMDIMEKDN